MSTKTKEHFKPAVYVICIVAALAGLLFGLDIGVISGVLPFLKVDFHPSNIQLEWVVSAVLAGAAIGAALSGIFTRKYGRRNILLVAVFIFGVSSFLCAIAVGPTDLIFYRLILGFSIGIASFTAPIYLSEVAPYHIRGKLVAIYQLMITIGIFLAFLSDKALSGGGHWRLMLGILLIPAAIMFVCLFFLPKSPRWLMLVNREDEAKKVLQKTRVHEEQIKNELDDIKQSLSVTHSLKQMLSNKNFIRVFLLGIALQAFQQLTGYNVMMYYAPEIFKHAGFASVSGQLWGTVSVGFFNMIFTFIAIALVDKIGRKPLLLAGFALFAVAMIITGLMFMLDTPTAHYIALITLFIVIFAYSMSIGPIVWIYCSEIFPLAGRDLGMAGATVSNWVFNMIIGATFLSLLSSVGISTTFIMYGVLCVIFFFIGIRIFPETKNVPLEKIEENLMSGKPLKKIGDH
ncbi:MAG: sugar porter family MFS transporter [bacterium]|nr:sugar porter family MFS transporter [bacterium]